MLGLCSLPAENLTLGADAFACLLCSTSHIREAMIKVMSHRSVRHPPGPAHGRWDTGELDAVSAGGGALEESQFPMDPSTCTFWCAVAVGALVKGRPIESVRKLRALSDCPEKRSFFCGCSHNTLPLLPLFTVPAKIGNFHARLLHQSNCWKLLLSLSSQVEHYSRLAGDALESYSGPVTADLSK